MKTKSKSPKLFKTKIKVGTESVTITLPKEEFAKLKMTSGDAYVASFDGVLQISGSQPQMVIPVLNQNSFQSK